ncbi:MAG: DUF4172 domain-containing protein, partial [Phycisphaerae bacterium]|nr:DUF4172 domain-containing protein [Phycisphaerae bacterium]
MYIYERAGWPDLRWDEAGLAVLQADVRHRQGRLLGRMEAIGFTLRQEATVKTLTQDVVKSSAIEGEKLDPATVRSSIARKLGLEAGGVAPADRYVDGVVEVMLDATRNYEQPLSADRLFGWHAALFPTGRSGLRAITVGGWRTDEGGPMQVVSGPIGQEAVHYQAPAHDSLAREMDSFIAWFNR